jgi:oligoendopeptidase F
VDVYPTPGKSIGGYTNLAEDSTTHPHVLINFQGTLYDVFMIAHEMGHAMNSLYSSRKQPPEYLDERLVTSEVASQFNEFLVIQWFLNHMDDEFDGESARKLKMHLINYNISMYRVSLVRQTMLAEFERDVAQMMVDDEAITADTLNAHYAELSRQYYGDGIVPDELIGIEWARIPHFYEEFYVYSYAMSFAAAEVLSQDVLSGDEAARESYLEFLSAGDSRPQLDLLRSAGVDMSTPAPIVNALNKLNELVDELSRLSGIEV